MLTEDISLKLMQQCLDGLLRSGMIDGQIIVKPDIALFGEGSPLDSMGFVTFVTDMEERIVELSNKDIFIVLSDIEEMYPNSPVLTASMFANYLASITN